MLLVEDVGEPRCSRRRWTASTSRRPLSQRRGRTSADSSRRHAADRPRMYRRVDRIRRTALSMGNRRFPDDGIAERPAGTDLTALAPELDDLAARLGRLPRVLSHRDYHGHNLFLQNGRISVIDFQDALLAPAAQDLAVLLTTRDTEPRDRPRRRAPDARLLLRGPRAPRHPPARCRRIHRQLLISACCSTRSRSSAGSTGSNATASRGYAAFIPYAIEQARRSLTLLAMHPAKNRDFPRLRAAFGVR